MPKDYPKRRTDVDMRIVDGEAVLLDLDGKCVHQLNLTATMLWQRCDGQSSIAELANQLAQTYAIDDDMALRDVTATLEQFEQQHLLET